VPIKDQLIVNLKSIARLCNTIVDRWSECDRGGRRLGRIIFSDSWNCCRATIKNTSFLKITVVVHSRFSTIFKIQKSGFNRLEMADCHFPVLFKVLCGFDCFKFTLQILKPPMASSGDSWVREYNEAVRLSDDITNMISERNSLPASGPEAQRHASSIRRKITILGTRLDNLQSLLSKLPGKQSLSEKEMNRRRDRVSNLRSKVNQMASTLNMSNFANRDSLLGPEIKPVDAMSRISGLDNHEQDEGLEKLEETVISTKHIALADNLDEHVEVTDSRLQRVQRRLAILNKRTKGGCSCLCLLLSVIGIVVLVAIIYLLVKYL
ncbi:syntaxin of plants 52, partial [Striga asiatica]